MPPSCSMLSMLSYQEVRSDSRCCLDPRSGPMWVRMMAYPGGAAISGM